MLRAEGADRWHTSRSASPAERNSVVGFVYAARRADRAAGATQSRSISTDTERCRMDMETISRYLFLMLTIRPSTPSSGPCFTRTDWPSLRKGQGPRAKPDCNMARTAAISDSSTGRGFSPDPTIETTPGVISIGSLCCGSNLQNVYPENKGRSISLTRSDHLWRTRYKGRNVVNPLNWRASVTGRSKFDLVRMTYQLRSCIVFKWPHGEPLPNTFSLAPPFQSHEVNLN